MVSPFAIIILPHSSVTGKDVWQASMYSQPQFSSWETWRNKIKRSNWADLRRDGGNNIRSGSWINTRQDMEWIHLGHDKVKWQVPMNMVINLKADSHTACHTHAVTLPCRAAKGLECVFPIWFTQCGHVWFTLAMPYPCHALTMPFFSRPWHSTAIVRQPVSYLPAFGFFWLPCGVPWRLLSEAYQSSSQWSILTTVKSGSSTLQNRQCVKLLD